MDIKTTSLDRAAFFLYFGGKLLSITGEYPENVFLIKTSSLIAWYEYFGGPIPYRGFCNKRKYLKRLSRKKSNLPEHFTGHKNLHFTFEDLAIFIPWKKKKTLR